MGVGRWLERLEDGVEVVLEAGRLRLARRRASRFLCHKSSLRGHGCHCAADQAIHLVHSEALREGADVVVDYGSNVTSPQRPQLPVDALAEVAAEIGDGDVVHVKSNLLPAFLEHVFPRLAGPIVLVTGDADYGPVADHRHLLDDGRIVHWFAQNCDVPERHPRLTRVPIGIDNPRYSRLEKRIGFALATLGGRNRLDWSCTRNDMGDQALLGRVLSEIRTPFRDRSARALCTFHVNQKFIPNFRDIPERAEAFAELRDNPACGFVARRVSQEDCWRLHERFAFEVSPRGKGLDCFRTWEALALGCVPIVKSSLLDPLFLDEGFPVVIVRSFAEVTGASLERWKAAHAHRFDGGVLERLSAAHWLARIRAARQDWRDGRR
jgi:hypothetical protein